MGGVGGGVKISNIFFAFGFNPKLVGEDKLLMGGIDQKRGE